MAHPGRPRTCDPKVAELRIDIYSNQFDKAKSVLQEFGIDATDGEGRTALINATIEDKRDFIQWLIDNGANINHQDRIGLSPLHFAAQANSSTLTKLFLEKGANPDLQDIHGNIPLWTALFNSKRTISDTVKLLLKHRSNYDLVNNYGRTPKLMFETFYKSDITKVDLSGI